MANEYAALLKKHGFPLPDIDLVGGKQIETDSDGRQIVVALHDIDRAKMIAHFADRILHLAEALVKWQHCD
jgi:hypothetical protein